MISAVPSYSDTKGMYVLCYHAFIDRKDPYSFSMDQFRDQIHRLKKSGFTFVSFEDVINQRIKGTKNILVTIDDGNKSVYEAYYSIMKPMGIKPVLGIYPAIIGRMHYAMTWDQVKKLSDDGCYIASHGYHHMYLSTKYHDKEPESFNKEIYYSKKVLEEKLGKNIDTMIFPFGLTSDIAISELKNAGYKYGMSLVQKMAMVPLEDNFMIPRYMLTKPNQKGLIAYFSQNADKVSASLMAANQVSEATSPGSDKSEYRFTLKNYPQEIHKMVMNDIIFMPDKKIAEAKPAPKKKQPKFKPFKHKNAMTEKISKSSKKQTSLQPKKSEDKEGRKQSTFLKEIKDSFFAIQGQFTSMIYSIREITANKIAVIKTKAFALFS